MENIKIDWLSFTFKPSDDEKATFSNICDAFFAHFPKIKDIMQDCVCVSSGRYYSYSVCWNDGILFSWDDDKKKEAFHDLKNGLFVDEFEHGFNVSIPSHGLHYLMELTGFDVSADIWSFKPVLEFLKKNNCQISRLDLAFDDYSKTFTPFDILTEYWLKNNVQSPCKKFKWCEAGKGGGQTFYLGARANKLLRIYDKDKESKGVINAIRYEIEVHNKYAEEICQTIINDSFDFGYFLQKWFIRLKTPSTCDSLDNKRKASMRPDLPEWVAFVKHNFDEQKSPVIIPKDKKAVNFERSSYWFRRDCVKTLYMLIAVNGADFVLDMLHDVNLSPRDMLIIQDALRIYEKDKNTIDMNLEKMRFLRDLSHEEHFYFI